MEVHERNGISGSARPAHSFILRLLSAIVICCVVSSLRIGAAGAAVKPALSRSILSVESELAGQPLLRAKVDFWKRIYGEIRADQGVVHDAKYPEVVYEVVDLGRAAGPKERLIRESKEKWRSALLSVHRRVLAGDNPKLGWSVEERHVFELFRDVKDPAKFQAAAHRKRLRWQKGQKDPFLEGLYESGRYLVRMEEVFRRHGLPIELTRLPFVESSFNTRARSKVGASGIWQFMPATGRLFLMVSELVDERNDPIRATEAAARLLEQNFESLGSWPLAITAYNHGRQGMMRAVRQVGSTRMDDIFQNYRSRPFGFASSNFFACFLAAVEVERNALRYFGQADRAPSREFFEVKLPRSARMGHLGRIMDVDRSILEELNPALAAEVFRDKYLIPAGYTLRLPLKGKLDADSSEEVFWKTWKLLPPLNQKKSTSVRNL